jgi:CRP/FNR family transcriptional activator FtrB
MREHEHAALRELALFSSMQPDSFRTLMRASFLQRFPPQVVLIREGEPADFLYVLVEGAVELFASTANRESTIAVLAPVTTFILAAVIKDATYLMSGRTLAPSRLLMIPSENIRAAFTEDPAFAQAMVVELAGAFRFMVRNLKNQKLRTGVERLANYLLRLRHEAGGAHRFQLPYEKRLLASLLGMTPENLSRAFATLAPYGVAVRGSEIELGKIKDLETLAKPTPLIDQPD